MGPPAGKVGQQSGRGHPGHACSAPHGGAAGSHFVFTTAMAMREDHCPHAGTRKPRLREAESPPRSGRKAGTGADLAGPASPASSGWCIQHVPPARASCRSQHQPPGPTFSSRGSRAPASNAPWGTPLHFHLNEVGSSTGFDIPHSPPQVPSVPVYRC